MARKKCDHTSVGMLVWKDNKLLLIERRKPPFGVAPPAGHVDEHGSYERAVKKELMEEVGLTAEKLSMVIEGRKNNPCRREGGTWHYWKIYQVEVNGEIKRSLDETKSARWYSKDEVNHLARRTERYLVGEILEKGWKKTPGLEPVWYEWFKGLHIIQ